MNHRHHNWSKVAVFDHVTPAEDLAKFLTEQGFEARVYDERRLQRFWFLAKPRAGLQVQVPYASQQDVAEALAANPRSEAYLLKAIRCPACDSPLVNYPQMTRKNVMPTLVAHCLVLVGLLEHEFYCEVCHHTWLRNSRKKSPAVRSSAKELTKVTTR